MMDDSAAKRKKYKVTKEDPEAANGALNHDFDPFKARVLDHPVSDCDTLTHLLKASLGTGILAMPAAFMSAGLVVGIFATIIVAIICTHCSYILVVCAHELYKRSGKTVMSFADVAEESCRRGPKWSKPFAYAARQIVLQGIFVTYFTTCSCYAVIVAKNFEQVASHYMGAEVSLRLIIAILLIPLIILSYIPNLKYLAPVSMVANVFMAVGLGITFYYLVSDIPPITERRLVSPISTFPVFFSITIFAIEAIGVVMPLENNMETPQHFVGICGVLNQGMSGVTLIYIFLGFLGYLKYGDETLGSITLNLEPGDYAAQAVKILIALAVFCTFGLQFYVALDIVWNGIKDYDTCRKFPTIANYILRTVLVTLSVVIAIAVPTITPFVSLIGAFCFSILGLLVPVFLEIITFWDKGFGKYNWKIWKNVVVVIAGIFALVFGSKSAIEDIATIYTT
ncbi:PREDICTED: proton-coupled amino acid transporter-like protein pathetic isoform X2 [Nicrophorus vespilloides]|uniref:Proton-coupled amino acid transporter-like protein pathetic isoform X2 n=1 Tax=Nicrophorus vespilloides TaxID=110193 RepID=A0ABM1MGE5_NICVS|nr:PREDICTED: proton-coupled amino acid transporter-like protein pathetic isoform X2 [Nicrophorus vespilloides]